MIDDFLKYMRASGATENTVNLRRVQLRRLEKEYGRDLASLSFEDLTHFLASRDWNRETIRSHRAAFMRFYRWAYECGKIDSDIAKDLPRVRSVSPVPRPASRNAYEEALAKADGRERLMLRLAAEAGLRRGEVARVHSRDFLSDLLGFSLIVHGKGEKERIVPLNDSLAVELRRVWCEQGEGWLFPSSTRDNHIEAEWVGKLVRRLLPKGVSMHQLRHRFATVVYERSGDLLAVQQLLGHASPATTQRYVAISDEHLRKVALLASH